MAYLLGGAGVSYARVTQPVAGSETPVASNGEIDYQRAVEYLERWRRDDIGQAVRLFNQVVKALPQDPRGHAGLAEARAIRYLWGWEPDPAKLQQGLASGKSAVELDPDSAEARQGLGLALMASELYTPALAELSRATALKPGSFRAHLYRGMLLRGLQRPEEALSEAQLALNLAPDSAVARALIGDCQQDRRLLLQARAAYLAAAELDQRLLWARLGLAATYQRDSNLPAAEKTYLFSEQEFPEDATRIHILAASMLVVSQRYEDAVLVYQAISEKEALSPPLFRRLMQAGRAFSLGKLNRREESEYFYDKLVDEFPADFDGGFRDRELASQGYEALARIYESKGEPKRAQGILEKGCQNRGMTFGLYAACAEELRASGRLEAAVGTLRRGMAQMPADVDWVIVTERILPTLRSVASAPKVSSKTRSEGVGLLDDLAGRISKAEPDSFVPYLNLARAEALFRMNQRALQSLEVALKRGYGGIRASQTDPDFKALVGDPAFRAMAGTP
jgi:tetratricopeptide (TPR) repeat protein